MNELKDWFGVERLGDKVRLNPELGEEVSSRFLNNIDTLITSAAEDMDAKVGEFIESVISKVRKDIP